MPINVSFSNLADTIADELGLSTTRRRSVRYDVIFDSNNNLEVSTSFAGRYSSPYAGYVRLDPAAPETIELAHDFLSFLAQESELPSPKLGNDDPLLPLIAEIVSNDQAMDLFFEVLTTNVKDKKFDLEAALAGLQARTLPANPYREDAPEQMLLGVEAWGLDEVRRQNSLVQLLDRLATDDDLPFIAKNKLREYKWESDKIVHDHRHYLLFGQTSERITPMAWFEAAWDFIEQFRCNFGMLVTEAMLYETVTIVGAFDASVAASEADEYFLKEYTGYRDVEAEDGTRTREESRWRQVERLHVTNAKQLSALLDARIKNNIRFEGGDVYPP